MLRIKRDLFETGLNFDPNIPKNEHIQEVKTEFNYICTTNFINNAVNQKAVIEKIAFLMILDISNYRQNSTFTQMSKLFDKLFIKRRISYLQKYNIFSKSPFGFEENFGIYIFIDSSYAFNNVSRISPLKP